MKSLKTNPAYKANALAALKAAEVAVARNGDFAEAARIVLRQASPSRLRGMRFTPQDVVLRALGLRCTAAFNVYGGINATYVAGTRREFAHKSGWRGFI